MSEVFNMKKNEIDYYLTYVKEILPKGKSRAIHQSELAERLGITPAALKNIIRKLRKMGVPICSGSDGYWIAKDDDEIMQYAQKERNLALSKLQTVKALNGNNTMQGQIEIDLCVDDNINIDCSSNLKGF